ncbi:MAG: glutamate--tRNA ligase family protein [Oligoflexales bacterium]
MNLRGIENRLQGSKLRTRFAPTPNGYLHLGHVAHCIYVWGIARALNGTVVLRMEDHDRQRARPEYIASIMKDLEWLGFVPDEGYDDGVKKNPYLQSAFQEPYYKALKLLADMGCTYLCSCTRKQVKERLSTDPSTRGYDGLCRYHAPQAEEDTCIRLKVGNNPVSFWDSFLKIIVQEPGIEFGDLLLVDKKKNFSYHLSVVVDDLRHDINFVIRGLDLLASTGAQIYLRKLLAPEVRQPIFAHHPLLLHKQNPKVKLSKRNWDESIGSLRDQGFTTSQLIGQVAYELGLANGNRELKVSELGNLWDV